MTLRAPDHEKTVVPPEPATTSRSADGSAKDRRVPVSLGERSYDIRIKPGLLGETGTALRGLGLSGKVAIVTNPIVARLYGRKVARALRDAGFEVRTIVVPEGERSKSMSRVGALLDELARARLEGRSILVALGGGVIGDLAGFAASVYQRGIPFVQIPTTLVAQVDSSVGGKTGVNHPLGKNLIGSFYQPRAVLIDPETLESLPRREWVAGLAEVIKYGMIADAEFFEYLERRMDQLVARQPESVVHAVARSCEIKASVVARDEREAGLRRILNYGHTLGHALETLGRYCALVHGEAVAIGMVQEADLARWQGFCGTELVARQRAIVARAGLPVTLPDGGWSALWQAMLHDKKVAGGRVHCVFPERIGRVVVAPLDRETFKAWWSGRARAGRA